MMTPLETGLLVGFVLLLLGAGRRQPGLTALGSLVQLASVVWWW